MASASNDEANLHHYTVYPTDPSQSTQVSETETLLKDLCGGTNVTPNQHDDSRQGQVTDSWHVTSMDNGDLATTIKAVKGVRLVEKPNPLNTHAIRSEDDTTYYARANTSFDRHKTEEFLKSKVRKGTVFVPFMERGDKGKVLGWFPLALDPDSKAAVEQYEGIESVRVSTKIVDFRALPFGDQSQAPQIGRLLHERSNRVSARDSKWEKQANDRQGQVTDSWSVASVDNGDLATTINASKGVRLVEKSTSLNTHTARSDVGTTYVAMANTSFDWRKTEEFLKTKVQNDIKFFPITVWNDDSQVFGWYHLALDMDSKAAVEQHEGIQSLRITTMLRDFRALPLSAQSQSPQRVHQTHAQGSNLSARDNKWQKQEKADKALVMDSQFPGADLNKLADFVHVPEPGENTFVYIMDRGVRTYAYNPMYEYEFHPEHEDPNNIVVLQTATSLFEKQSPWEDHSESGFHGTFVASKAIGTQFGVAKKATLIPVKMTYEESDFLDAFKQILSDLSAHPERQDRSVVLVASGSEEPDTYDNVKRELSYKYNYEIPMRSLLAMGVPIVLAAGNFAQEPNRQNIDSRPQIYQSEDIPLINSGLLVTVYAPGDNVEGLFKDDFTSKVQSGTSMAAPQVAGLVATYLSHEPTRQRWSGVGGVERVKAIREYLVSDSSSWIRKSGSGIRTIWNGAGEEDHKNSGASSLLTITNPATPPLQNDAPLPPKTKALSIILQNVITEADNINQWLFHLTNQGQSALCRNDKNNKPVYTAPAKSDPGMVDNPPLPGGIYPIKIDGMDCEYKNNGQNTGALWCKEKNGQAIPCNADSMMGTKEGKKCDLGVYEHAVVYCEW
ncbi:peptidase S8/S53 domain-containing protein [Pyrenochaeta sp. MPI-SDFR-AT-0127]|nr:peptidase S8/S53 domain-containing protein [Pyrenochaeta sp. MPI-SDFR-AT-0127]